MALALLIIAEMVVDVIADKKKDKRVIIDIEMEKSINLRNNQK